MTKRISEAETEKAVEKIRKKYNDLIVMYMLDPRIKSAFEQRLFEIRAGSFDPARFLRDEIESLLEIEKKERDKINNAAKKSNLEKQKKDKIKESGKKDFADRVLEDIMAKIEKYPDIFIHQNANPEIRKLIGTLIDYDLTRWSYFEKLAKKYRINRYDPAFTRLENMLNNFTRIYTDDIPARLAGYRTMLNSSFARNKDIGKEEKLIIFECAYLVKSLKDTLLTLTENPELLPNEKEKLLDSIDYLDRLTDDFRLKDLMTLVK
ncbi:MAG: hypothetical protein RBT69_12510 [Spirochaetia bacterium]|jgi:ASC-1-like (ASCH) protein|nr:hypothetical protein [Spirochaetia bacterium]